MRFSISKMTCLAVPLLLTACVGENQIDIIQDNDQYADPLVQQCTTEMIAGGLEGRTDGCDGYWLDYVGNGSIANENLPSYRLVPNGSDSGSLSAARCLACDGIQATSPSGIQERFACLEGNKALLASITGEPAYLSNAYREVERQQILIFELLGNHLTNDQQEVASKLYGYEVDDLVGCGKTDLIDNNLENLSETAFSTLKKCERLSASHVPVEVAGEIYNECFEIAGIQEVQNLCVESADRVIDSLLSRLLESGYDFAGTSQTSTKSTNTKLKQALDMYDSEEEDSGIDPQEVEKYVARLKTLDRWYWRARHLAGLGEDDPETEVLAQRSSRLLRSFWARAIGEKDVFGQLSNVDSNTSFNTILRILANSRSIGFGLDQTILAALFRPHSEDGHLGQPLRGPMVATIVADGTKALVDRLDLLATYHDLACSILEDCAISDQDAPMAQLWRLVANLENRTALENLTAEGDPLLGWKTVFKKIAASHSYLNEVILRWRDQPVEERPEGFRSLMRIIEIAKSRSKNYAETGEFNPVARNVLRGSMLENDKNRVITDVTEKTNNAQIEINDYMSRMSTVIAGWLTSLEEERHDENQKRSAEILARKQDLLAQDLIGLHAAFDADQKTFGDIVAKFGEISESLDSGKLIQVRDTKFFSPSANKAKAIVGGQGYVRGKAKELAVKALDGTEGLALTRGEVVMITTSGQWAPTCAITKIEILDPDGLDTVKPTAAMTGPEGYSMQWTDSGYTAESVTNDDITTDTKTVGARGEVCVTAGGAFSKLTGYEARACAYAGWEHGWTDTETERDTDGTEKRMTASFNGGLRLKNTPFSNLPAGSLLAVLTNADDTVLDIRVVQAPQTSILVENNSKLYFVVNDLGTCSDATTDALSVTVNTYEAGPEVAKRVVQAMSAVLTKMRNERELLEAQGRLVAGQLAFIRSAAYQLLDQEFQDGLELELPLERLFDAFVNHEILALARSIEMQSVEREIDLLQMELSSIEKDIAAGKKRSRLLLLTPTWILRNLDGQGISQSAQGLMDITRNRLLPILKLWYPTVIEETRFDQNIADLSLVTLDANDFDLNNKLVNLLGDLLERLRSAQLGRKADPAQRPIVAVRIPASEYFSGFNFGGQSQLYRTISADRANLFWSAATARDWAQLSILPEDIYSMHGAERGVLPCTEAFPIVYTMAVYLVRKSATDNDNVGDWLAIQAGDTQQLASPDGPVEMTYDKSLGGSDFQIHLMAGNAVENVQKDFEARRESLRSLGFSPFMTWNISFKGFDVEPAKSWLDSTDEVVVMMEVDSEYTPELMSWVGGGAICVP